MRELKFRAWDRHAKAWASFHSMIPCVDWNRDVWPQYFSICATDFEVIQYTGLHDRRGVEIYEGDVVEDGRGRTVAVEWHAHIDSDAHAGSGYLLYGFDTIRDTAEVNDDDFVDCEVIGNIYENPELLKA